MILAACSSTPGDVDSGLDAQADVSPGMDASKDSATDAKADAGKDGSQDAQTDGSADAGEDAMDATADADDSGPMDAGGPDVVVIDGGGNCKSNFGFGSVSMNGCSAGENWTCGNDDYEFECYCPGNACECRKNKQAVGKVQSPMGCPNCNFNAKTIANLCGFPY